MRPQRPRRKDGASRRDRDLVRQLIGRALWSRGELCQVRGAPDERALLWGFERLLEGTLDPDQVSPGDLGWSSSAVQVISRRGLEARARALTRWRRVVAHRRSKDRRTGDEAHLEEAARGLADRRGWMRHGPGEGPCFPEDRRPRLAEGLAPGVRALARWVAWLGGAPRGEAVAAGLQALGEAWDECALGELPAVPAALWAAALALGARPSWPGLRGFSPASWGRLNLARSRNTAVALLEARLDPGGPGLLACAEGLARYPVAWEVEGLTELVADGLGKADLEWVVARALSQGRSFRDQAEPARAARVMRRADRLLERLLPEDVAARERCVDALYDALEQPGVAAAVEAFLAWVETLPLPQLDVRGRRDLVTTLRTLAVAGGRGPRLVSLLRRWSRPPRRLPEHPGSAQVQEEETRLELSRLALYQRWAGEEPRLPRPVAKRLGAGARRAGELAALVAREQEGALTPGARARLEHLRAGIGGEADESWVRRRLREARARVALAGLRRSIGDTVARGWRELFGQDPPELGEARLLELLAWADGLQGSDRRRLEELVAAWREHGAGYKRALPENRIWLERPPGDLDPDAWLAPPRRTLSLADGRKVTVEVAEDPYRVLLMGSLFDTCLALGGGFNRRAVLANAREVNKAVVFWTRADGAILGRKLVGLTARGELVGFHTYLAVPEDDPDRVPLDAAGTALARAWAQAAGVRLGSEGIPPVLGRAFWYDDGVEAWCRPGDAANRDALWREQAAAVQDLADRAGVPGPGAEASPELRREWLLEVARERGALPPAPWPGAGEVGPDAPDRGLVVATAIAGGEPPRPPARHERGRLEVLPVLGEGPRAQAWRQASVESGDVLATLVHGEVPGDPARSAARLAPVAEALAGSDWLPGDAPAWRWLLRLAYEERGRAVPAGVLAGFLRLMDHSPGLACSGVLALATLPASARRRAGLPRRDRARLERAAAGGDAGAARRLAAAAQLVPSQGMDAALARVAEGHPEALLALALRQGRAARARVRRGLDRWPERVAALLAWRVVTGEDAVFERHRQAPGAAPTRGRACAAARVLHRELAAGSPHIAEEALMGLGDWERREALPLLIDAWCEGRRRPPASATRGAMWTPSADLARVLVAALADRAPDEEVLGWWRWAGSPPAGELLLAARRGAWGGAIGPPGKPRIWLTRGDLALVPELAARGLLQDAAVEIASLREGWELPPVKLADALRALRGAKGASWEDDRPDSPLAREILEAVQSEAR